MFSSVDPSGIVHSSLNDGVPTRQIFVEKRLLALIRLAIFCLLNALFPLSIGKIESGEGTYRPGSPEF